MKYDAFTITANNGKLNQIKTEVVVQGNGLGVKINAIWDTGASGTCISKRVAQQLKLVPVGMSSHNTAAGTIDCYD